MDLASSRRNLTILPLRDGNYCAKPMPAGVYPFLITYEGKDEDNKGPFKKEGSVMVVR